MDPQGTEASDLSHVVQNSRNQSVINCYLEVLTGTLSAESKKSTSKYVVAAINNPKKHEMVSFSTQFFTNKSPFKDSDYEECLVSKKCYKTPIFILRGRHTSGLFTCMHLLMDNEKNWVQSCGNIKQVFGAIGLEPNFYDDTINLNCKS